MAEITQDEQAMAQTTERSKTKVPAFYAPLPEDERYALDRNR